MQAYTRRKKLETVSLRYRYKHKPKDCFSCVPPSTYGDRFYDFLSTNLFTSDRQFPESEIEKEKNPMQQSQEGGLLKKSVNVGTSMGNLQGLKNALAANGAEVTSSAQFKSLNFNKK